MPVRIAQKKVDYCERLLAAIQTYSKVVLIHCDNVGSNQMHKVRRALRGKSDIIMGKNTMIRRCLREYLESNEHEGITQLLEFMEGNVGMIFTDVDPKKVRDVLDEFAEPAPARVGAIAPIDVVVPAGPTGCDPGQTSYFQSMQIATKIQKGQIEIINDVHLLRPGDKVGASEASLLQTMNIRPFVYKLKIVQIMDGSSCFGPEILDLDQDTLIAKFMNAAKAVAAISIMTGCPSAASVPHSIANAFRTLVNITVGLDNYSFEACEPYKAYLKDPSAFAAAAGPATGGGGGAAAPAAVEEEEEEEEVDLGAGDMFGGGDADY
jgi:large subunit ribosomal protein LP0